MNPVALWGIGIYIQDLIYGVKVKESRNRPGVTHMVPGVLGSQIS